MIIKKLIGETMAGLGFVNQQQINEALSRQQTLIIEKTEQNQSSKQKNLNSESRLTAILSRTPLLGQILVEMGLISGEQVAQALAEQKRSVEVYKSLDSEKLGSAIEICSLINSTLDLTEVLHNIVKHVCRITDSVAGSLMLLDNDTGELVFSVPTGPQSEKLIDIRLPKGKGVAGWVAEHQRPVLVEDVSKDTRFFSGIDEMTGFETKTILCTPLKVKDNLIGVLEIINKNDGSHFTEEDALLLGIFANQAAAAIENARLHNELESQLEEIVEAGIVKQKLEEQLRQARKMEALGTMAGGIAHDFNNILSIILGYADMAVDDLPLGHPARRDVAEVLKASHKAKDLVAQVLTYTSRAGVSRVGTDVEQLFDESVSLIEEAIPSSISINKANLSEPVTVLADSEQIYQALANICSNASNAMQHNSGEIEMALEVVELSEEDLQEESDAKPGAFAKFTVKDVGHGIEENIIDRIFDPYFTTKDTRRGRGLGLAVVYGIIKKHDGLVKVESTAGKGTVFSIFLPIA